MMYIRESYETFKAQHPVQGVQVRYTLAPNTTLVRDLHIVGDTSFQEFTFSLTICIEESVLLADYPGAVRADNFSTQGNFGVYYFGQTTAPTLIKAGNGVIHRAILCTRPGAMEVTFHDSATVATASPILHLYQPKDESHAYELGLSFLRGLWIQSSFASYVTLVYF